MDTGNIDTQLDILAKDFFLLLKDTLQERKRKNTGRIIKSNVELEVSETRYGQESIQ